MGVVTLCLSLISLKRVHDSQNICRVCAGRGRVGEDGSDCRLGVYDENGMDDESDSFWNPHWGRLDDQAYGVERGDLSLLVANHGKFRIGIADLVDIRDPASVTLNGISKQTNEFNASSREL